MKKVSVVSIVIMSLIIALIGTGMPASNAATTYKNAVLSPDTMKDPYCFKDNGWFYVYSDNGGKRVNCWKSKDLVNWTSLGEVYNNIGHDYGGDTVEHLWSPEVYKINGKYYMYYVNAMSGGANSTIGNKDICVVEGTSPTDFDPSTRKVLLDNEYAHIDPSVFVDTNDKIYLYFKYRASTGDSQIRVRPMSDPKTFSDTGKNLLYASNLSGSSGQVEHPSVELKNGHYILFFSYGMGDSTGYKVGYAKASNPLGPFTLSGENPIMYTGQTSGVIAPGSTSIVQDGDGNKWMVYRQKQTSATDWDRVLCIDRCYITTAGNVNITATRGDYVTAPAPLP